MTPGSPNGAHSTRRSFSHDPLERYCFFARPGVGRSQGRRRARQICRVYWRPVFAFICRKGFSVPDAQDLTQDFFVVILNGNLLERADRTRGRFRSLLLAALSNFLADVQDRKQAQKRGGHVQFVAWDEWAAEAPSQLSVPESAIERWPAEMLFDVRWAATLAEQALRRLQGECESRGRRRVFDVLSGALTADREDVSYPALARELGVEEPKIKRLLHQMRQRYRELLRSEVEATIADPADVDDELRHLCSALAASANL